MHDAMGMCSSYASVVRGRDTRNMAPGAHAKFTQDPLADMHGHAPTCIRSVLLSELQLNSPSKPAAQKQGATWALYSSRPCSAHPRGQAVEC